MVYSSTSHVLLDHDALDDCVGGASPADTDLLWLQLLSALRGSGCCQHGFLFRKWILDPDDTSYSWPSALTMANCFCRWMDTFTVQSWVLPGHQISGHCWSSVDVLGLF
ncbi:hypothetical protein OIU76_002001 [Salix suchowensis]|nr:hypothetical protein OIU76_002001 [Salix suchowensis]